MGADSRRLCTMFNTTVAMMGTDGNAPGIELTVLMLIVLLCCWIGLQGDLVRYDWCSDDKSAEVAKHIIAGLCCLFFATFGGLHWFNPPVGMADSSQDRLYAWDDSTQAACWFFVAYQLWDLIVCMLVPALQNPISYTHHSVTALLAWLCTWPYLHYYSWFFIGFGEVSTVALA